VKDLGKMQDLALQLRELLNMPGYMQLLRFHEDIISELPKTGNTQKDLSLKMSYLLWVIRMRDISGISENLLRERRDQGHARGDHSGPEGTHNEVSGNIPLLYPEPGKRRVRKA
jgi:hypothetical protein